MKLEFGNGRTFNPKLATVLMMALGVVMAIAFTYWLYAIAI